MAESIETRSLRHETEKRYLTYAMSVITSRALPDIRDGLKPVQRRILYTMYHDLHLAFDGRTAKCVKITGAVTGNYHPHGDVAVYEALVRLAQGLGDARAVGSHGREPSSVRWTAIRRPPSATPRPSSPPSLNPVAHGRVAPGAPFPCRSNFDNIRWKRPIVLPAQFPNLLVNGASGIAVGMATNMPPHNLRDVCAAAVHLIENSDATVAQLLDKLKGPDFPLGGKVVTDRATLRKIYEEGTGTIKVQGEWKLEENGKNPQIVITSIPYGVDKGKLENDIGIIIESRKLPQLLSLTNESNEKEGMRIAMEIKAGSDPELIMAYLYRHTALQENFSYNLTCLVPLPSDDDKERTVPRRLSLKEMLQYFLDFRLATVRRRFEFELEQLRKRIHILEGFQIIFNALDKAIKLIRESDGKADAAEKLIKTFKLTEIQADAILDAQLYKIAQLEIKKIIDELEEKTAEAKRLESILASEKKLWGVVKTELNEVAEKYGDKRRRTSMGSSEDALGLRSGGVHRPREYLLVWVMTPRRLDQARGPPGVGGRDARPRGRCGAGGGSRQHAGSRRLLHRRRRGLHDAHERSSREFLCWRDEIASSSRLDDQVRIVNAITTGPRFPAVEEMTQGAARHNRICWW